VIPQAPGPRGRIPISRLETPPAGATDLAA
jgi:hypothetical protein